MYNGSCSVLGITLIICVIAHVHSFDDKSRNGSVILGDASVAESRNPVKKYVSSGYKNGNEQGYAKKRSWKDGDGYDTLETTGNSDKDKYGFISEEGFGSRKSGASGKKPDVEKHSYKKTKKNGKDWEFRNAGGSDEESHEKTAGKGKGRKSYKKTFEKPIRYRKASSSSSNSPRSERLVASPTDKLYDFSMTYDTPAVTGYQQQQQQAAQRHTLPPLPRLTSTRTNLPYQPANKRGAADTVSHLTDYGNGFQTQIYHNPNAFNQGPVLFDQKPVVASPEEATQEEEGEELSEEKPKIKRRAGHLSSGANAKSRKNKKGGKKPQKSAKYSEYDGLDLNYDASVENDGGESEGDYDNNDYSYNDYGDSGEANDGGDYDEEENDGGESDDSAEANDYDDYESNDYDYDGGEENETKKPKKSKKKPESESYELDSYGSFTKIVPDYHRGRFIYASEADKDATYR